MTRLAIIGTGIMAQYSAKALASRAEQIFIYHHNKQRAELLEGLGVPYTFSTDLKKAVEDSDFVLYCVPTDRIEEVMGLSLPHCKKGAIISGQTSRKTPEKRAFDRFAKEHPEKGLEMITIHSMCNPRLSSPEHEILAIIPNGCSPEAYKKALEFYGSMSDHIEHYRDVEEHDLVLANTQVNTSRTNLSIAGAFAHAGVLPWTNESYGHGLDVMKFAMAMRTASFPGHVYRGIQFGNEHGQRFVTSSENLGAALKVMVQDPETHGKRLEENILNTKRKLFGERKKTILRDEDVARFGIGKTLPNSEIALILYAMDDADKGRNPFAYLKGTTPMHTAQLCMVDYLFNKEGLLEECIEAIKRGITKEDDEAFFREWLAWADAIRLQKPESYDAQHRLMSERLEALVPGEQMQKYLDLGKEVVAVCRQRMNEAIASGLFHLSAL